MKKTIYTFAFLFVSIGVLAQDITSVETETTVERYYHVPTSVLNGDFNDNDTVYEMSKSILAIPKNDEFVKNLKAKVDATQDWAIIFVHHGLVQSTVDGAFTDDMEGSKEQVLMTFLHKEKKPWNKERRRWRKEQEDAHNNEWRKDDYDWSEYLYNTKNIMLILLGETGLDSEFKPHNLGINITNKESFTKTSFKELVTVIKKVLTESKGIDSLQYTSDGEGVPCRLIYLKRTNINPPSDIDFSVPFLSIQEKKSDSIPIRVLVENSKIQKIKRINDQLINTKLTSEDSLTGQIEFSLLPGKEKVRSVGHKKISFNIHERNHFAFSLGVTGAQFDRKDFLLDTVRNIAIAALDTAKQKDWISNLNVNVEFYPFGRDIDRLEPFLKKPLYKLYTRFGFYGGVRLSKDPFTALNAGFSFSYSKTVTLTFGWTWVDNRVADVQQVSVGEDVKDIEKAKDYFNRKYERSKFSIGLTFAPSQIAKSLGIGGDD